LPKGERAVRVTWKQVSAFRLSRHHLTRRAPESGLAEVAADMLGAQAQILQAAQLSLWASTRVPSIKHLDDAIWKRRTLVRAWGMKRTMFLIPSDKLSLLVRSTARRPESGRATGIWSHAVKKDTLEVSVSLFSRLPAAVTSGVRREASELRRFLGCPEVKVSMGQA